jgi:hypothetical protein
MGDLFLWCEWEQQVPLRLPTRWARSEQALHFGRDDNSFPNLRPESLRMELRGPGMFGRLGGVEIVVADVGLHFDLVVGVEAVAGAKSSPAKQAPIDRVSSSVATTRCLCPLVPRRVTRR